MRSSILAAALILFLFCPARGTETTSFRGARLADSRGRVDNNSGYTRLFGNSDLGRLISRVHATVIRSGNDLEQRLRAATSPENLFSLEKFLSTQKNNSALPERVVVYQAKMKGEAAKKGIVADVVVILPSEKRALVIELKDGDTFDTKKSSGELASLQKFAQWFASATDYRADYFLCSFNQENKENIVAGLKGRFLLENVMTGAELCALLQVDIKAINNARAQLQNENLIYFLRALLDIPAAREIIRAELQTRRDK